MTVDAHPGTAPLAAPRPAPPPVTAATRVLAAVPGATYAAVVDQRSGALVSEAGAVTSGAELTAVLAWARRASALPGAGGLVDLVVTTDQAFHVIGRGPDARVWIYLRVDRRRGNLALARRALAAGRVADGLPRRSPAAIPVLRSATGPESRSGPAYPAPAAGWSSDVPTLRRLLAGLHRLTDPDPPPPGGSP